MTDLSDYHDAREGHPDFARHTCPTCGVGRWFKRLDKTHWRTEQWNCRACGSYLHDVLELPCPDCGTRMQTDGGQFRCAACDAAVSFPKAKILNRFSGIGFPDRVHKPGSLGGDCPLCDDGRVNGGPDGELTCSGCDFYAGQYSSAWYCYGIWLESPAEVRVVGYDD